MNGFKAGAIAMSFAACLIAAQGGLAQSGAQGKEDEVQPKFVWGVLLRFAGDQALSAFTEWLKGKIGDFFRPGTAAGGDRAAAGAATPPSEDFIRRVRAGGDTTGGAFIARNPSAAPVSVRDAAPVTFGNPSAPIKSDAGYTNYQGVHIAIVGIGPDGIPSGFRSLNDGFRTGERIKLRVVSTFGGLLVIDNINPRGERRQIYPAEPGSVVVLRSGGDALLPLGRGEFFEFARTVGVEELAISLRDARATGAAASRAGVYRRDESYGSNFVQEVAKDTFPAISESIRLVHQ